MPDQHVGDRPIGLADTTAKRLRAPLPLVELEPLRLAHGLVLGVGDHLARSSPSGFEPNTFIRP
jgi:hypothetical protein